MEVDGDSGDVNVDDQTCVTPLSTSVTSSTSSSSTSSSTVAFPGQFDGQGQDCQGDFDGEGEEDFNEDDESMSDPVDSWGWLGGSSGETIVNICQRFSEMTQEIERMKAFFQTLPMPPFDPNDMVYASEGGKKISEKLYPPKPANEMVDQVSKAIENLDGLLTDIIAPNLPADVYLEGLTKMSGK